MLPTGQGGGASHQRGNLPRPPGRLACFPTPTGRLYGFRRQRRYKKWRRRRRTSPVERYFIPPEGGALNPSGRRQPVPDRTLGAQGQRPGGAINPRPRKRASTFGNTGKHRPGPDSPFPSPHFPVPHPLYIAIEKFHRFPFDPFRFSKFFPFQGISAFFEISCWRT